MSLDDKIAYVGVKLGHLVVERDREEYLRKLVELCANAVDADRCTIYLVDHTKGELRARVAQRAGVDIVLALGRGLAGQSASSGETINVPDAYADARFDPTTDLRSGYRTRNMLVVPVWGSAHPRRVAGVIQVLNRRVGSFERSDQMLLERVAETVSPIMEQMAQSQA